jgi:UDP-perosamine 4-acetyltransferase
VSAVKEKIVVIAGGGHAKVLTGILRKNDTYDILGYTDIENRGAVLGTKYLGNDDVLASLITNYKKCKAVLGLGYISVSQQREKIYNRLKELGFEFPAIVSRDAVVNEEVTIGEGTLVCDGVVINSGAKIGRCVIVNTNTTVEHDCILGDYCHLASGAVLGGGAEIGDYSIIGSNAVVLQNIKIKARTLVGSGSVVTKDISEAGVYAGVPVRKIK